MAHEVLIPPKVAAEIEAIGYWIAQDNPVARPAHDRAAVAPVPVARPLPRALPAVRRDLSGGQRGPLRHHLRIEPTPAEARVIIVAVMHASRDIRRILGIPKE